MASKVKKLKTAGFAASRLHGSSSAHGTLSTGESAPPSPCPSNTEQAALKSDILLELKTDILAIIRVEMKAVLAEDLAFIKSELLEVRTEVANSFTAFRGEIDQRRLDVRDVADGFSGWSNEIVALRGSITELRYELDGLKKRCETIDGRMRRSNVTIGIPEKPKLNTPAGVST